MEEINKKEQNGSKNYKHYLAPAKLKARTRYPLLQGIPIRGKLTILNDANIYFEDNDPQNHTRNKVVYKSTHFSARITADGGFSITCHTTCEKMLTKKGKAKLIEEFLRMMTTLEASSQEVVDE